MRPGRPAAFSLIELLVTISVIALLLSIMLPALQQSRMQARLVLAHSGLRQITIAFDAYAMDNSDSFPPMRKACGTNVNYQLPVELANQRYFPVSSSKIPQADFVDPFDPAGHTYKYRAPGPGYFNGQFFDTPQRVRAATRAQIYVPEDFPHCASLEGKFWGNFEDEPPSPVVYAVWSIGPDPQSPKFPRFVGTDQPDDNTFPLPRRLWMQNCRDTGLITHFRSREGRVHQSP